MELSGTKRRKEADILILPCWQGEPHAELAVTGKEYAVLSAEPLFLGDFRGKRGESLLIYLHDQPEKRALLVGMGKRERATAETVRRATAVAVQKCRSLRLETLNVPIPKVTGLGPETVAHALADGLLMANDAFDHHKHDTIKEEPTHLLKKGAIIGANAKQVVKIKEAQKVMEGIRLTRTLINTNADEVTSTRLAGEARKLSKKFDKVTTTVFTKQRIEKEGMGLILAVNKGSTHDPALIIIEYKGDARSKEKTVFVGKGITYDTGGLSLKPSTGMETMRTDMGGAATVLGTLKAAAALNLKVNLTGVLAVAENCIDGASYKVGDSYPSYSGKTVEVINTDAEGRLVLADALSYATKKLNPTRIIDMATLTGSVVIALGEEIAGLYTDHDDLAKELTAAGEQTGDRCWRMPLMHAYMKQLKSDVADIKNCGTRAGGSITAALFLKQFVGDTPWAHLDIAGTCYPDKSTPLSPSRATGYGIRLMVEFLQRQGRKRGSR